jgi:hypothetical protein
MLQPKYRYFQDPNPGVEYGDSAGGVAAGLHATRLPHPHGVRRHTQEDCPLPQVSTKPNQTELNHTKPSLFAIVWRILSSGRLSSSAGIYQTKPNRSKPHQTPSFLLSWSMLHPQEDCPLPQVFNKPNQTPSFCHRGVRLHTQEDCPLPQVSIKPNQTELNHTNPVFLPWWSMPHP